VDICLVGGGGKGGPVGPVAAAEAPEDLSKITLHNL